MTSYMEHFYNTCIRCQDKDDFQTSFLDPFRFIDMADCTTTDQSFPGEHFNVTSINGTVRNISVFQPGSVHQNVHRLKFYAYGVISSIIICLGIIGNISSLIVLTRPNLKGVTFVYLIWLAISDLMSLLVSLTSIFRLHGMQPKTYAVAVYYSYVEIPLANAFMASSVFLVVALTVERYFSVCLPTRFKEIHNIKRAKYSIAAAYIVPLLLYIPVCFQKKPVAVPFTNGTQYLACDYAPVAKNAIFKVYIMVKEIIVRLGPVILLAVLNISIIITFRKTLKKRRAMHCMPTVDTGSQHTEDSSRKYKEEQRLIILLAGIVILFFLSMTPAAILSILNSDDKEFNFKFQIFRAVANVLELSNFAMNFYVYCMCSSEIRQTFISLTPWTKSNSVASLAINPSVENNKLEKKG